jgi:hypothetical protein
MILSRQLLSAAALAALLAACGGRSDTTQVSTGEGAPVTTAPDDPAPVRADWFNLLNHCATPRTGLQANGLPYTDVQGTATDEKRWLRAFVNETYLWYDEVPTGLHMADYATPQDYFAVLKTPLLSASGRAKDRFHFTYPSAQWEALSSSGEELGYGITWQRNTDANAQRYWRIAMVEPGSQAAQAGLRRGDLLSSVDGTAITDETSAAVAALNAGLFPVSAGETHQLVLYRDAAPLTVSLASVAVTTAPVRNVKVIPTSSGAVGYLLFNNHNAVSEAALVDAFTTLRGAGVRDLVLDMRYNGGGYLAVARALAYMVAGPDATSGKVFEQLKANDKLGDRLPDRFTGVSAGLAPALLAGGVALPSLNLKRVTVLTTAGTCSASESVINSLRGVDIEVNLIGAETCGKPYAFVPAPNCGTTYFSIQLQGVNAKGFGDYADGFQPTCGAADDVTHELGDIAETMLATALSYRANGACPATPLRSLGLSGAMQLVRPQVKEIAILGH